MNLSLAEAIFWIAALACIAAQFALLRSSFRIKSDQRSELVPGSPRSVELMWAFVPAVVLCLLLFATWRRVAEPDEHRQMDHSTMGSTTPSPRANTSGVRSRA